MKAKRSKCLCLLLLLISVGFFTNTARADLTSDRAIACLDAYLADPWPSPTDPDPATWGAGKSGRALASLYRNTNLLVANQDVNAVCNYQDPLPVSGFDENITMYFDIPILCRIYLDPNCYGRLNNGARTNIRDMLWQFTKSRSKYWYATGPVWAISKSQNHEMTQKATYMLACQLLKPIKGGSTALDDGYTIDQHLAAWKKYFYEFFRQRAREGLNCEMASNGYDKYTVGGWYNVRDFSEDPNLRSFAGDFLKLYWSDYASDFLPFAGTRGGGETRWYKDNLGAMDSLRDVVYIYNWHDNVPGAMHPSTLMPLTSSYRNPAWLDALAGNPNRTAYLNTTRRYGKGELTYDSNTIYHVLFDPNHASHIRRDTWWHRDYVMGTVTYKTDGTTYSDETNQNRAVGVFYDSNGVTDRIIFDGNGTYNPPDNTIGFTEVTGICSKNCMVASWDKNARHNNGVFLYVTNGALVNNKSNSGNWIFTKTGPYGANARQFVADVNSTCARNELLLGVNSSSSYAATAPAVAGSGYPSGNCVDFNGVSNVAYATQGWKSYDSVKADFYFKADTTSGSTRVLINAPSTWEITALNRNLTFTAYNNVGSGSRPLTVTNAFKTGVWSHVTASINASGRMDFTVDANVCTPRTDPNVLKLKTTDIVLGNKPGTTRFFDGKIDTVNISIPSKPAGYNCIAAWNMDSAYTKDVYTGIWIATGGYRTVPDTVAGGGNRWVLLTKTSPVIFQVAPSDNWPGSTGYADFQAAAIAKNPSYSSSTLAYTSLDNESFTYYANSSTLPKIGTNTINLDPNETYKGPYVKGNHGMDTVTITDGTNTKDLNFNYIHSPNWDDYQTVALWHMDGLGFYYVYYVLDDYLENPNRGNTLRLYNRANANTVAGPMSSFAQAVAFDGTSQYADGNNPWPSHKTVKVDLWFKAGRATGTQVLATAANIWNLQLSTSSVQFDMWDTGGVAHTVTVNSCVTTGTWQHATATVDSSGNMKLVVDNYIPATWTSTGATMKTPTPATTAITLCNKPATTRYFQGSIDDVKISRYSTP